MTIYLIISLIIISLSLSLYQLSIFTSLALSQFLWLLLLLIQDLRVVAIFSIYPRFSWSPGGCSACWTRPSSFTRLLTFNDCFLRPTCAYWICKTRFSFRQISFRLHSFLVCTLYWKLRRSSFDSTSLLPWRSHGKPRYLERWGASSDCFIWSFTNWLFGEVGGFNTLLDADAQNQSKSLHLDYVVRAIKFLPLWRPLELRHTASKEFDFV